jgi:hypothetical protein
LKPFGSGTKYSITFVDLLTLPSETRLADKSYMVVKTEHMLLDSSANGKWRLCCWFVRLQGIGRP